MIMIVSYTVLYFSVYGLMVSTKNTFSGVYSTGEFISTGHYLICLPFIERRVN